MASIATNWKVAVGLAGTAELGPERHAHRAGCQYGIEATAQAEQAICAGREAVTFKAAWGHAFQAASTEPEIF